jgi:hypothetical protein
VRKELRNYLKGLRPSWTLYGRYRINWEQCIKLELR